MQPVSRFVAAAVLMVAGAAAPARAQKICIDPGHGGTDPGGTGCTLQEKQIVLDTSQRLKGLLEAEGLQVVMTRSTDVFIELGGRTDFANAQGADRFVSIHANAFGDASANGTETFCHTNASALSIDLRDKIQTEMIQAWGLRDRGGKTADFFVLRETNMPATLSELGFVTNCSVDAPVLGDPNQRQAAAEAHLLAIAEHLGIDPGNTPTTGELLGVVFEDQGVGTDDMSVRLPGANVVVVETGDVATASADGAAWTFTVAPGSYTVRASAAGHVTATRTCTVAPAQQAWCSIGLFPSEAGEGEGEGEPGEGEGEGEGEPTPEVPLVTLLPPEGGCAQTRSVASVAVLALLLLLVRARRRAPTLPAMALLLGVSASAQAAPTTGLRLGAMTEVARGAWASAQLSPSGERLLISDQSYDGLAVLFPDGTLRALTEAKRAGFRAAWVGEDRVAHRIGAAPFAGEPLVLLDLDGRFLGPHQEHAQVRAQQADGDRVVVTRDAAGVKREPLLISPVDDRCFAPMVSARGDVVFQCLVSGVWLWRASDASSHALGAGHAPAWSGDGSTLVFMRSRDEGHRVVESDLVLVDALARRPQGVVLTTPALERAPSLDQSGRRISFFVDDRLFVGAIERPPLETSLKTR